MIVSHLSLCSACEANPRRIPLSNIISSALQLSLQQAEGHAHCNCRINVTIDVEKCPHFVLLHSSEPSLSSGPVYDQAVLCRPYMTINVIFAPTRDLLEVDVRDYLQEYTNNIFHNNVC